MNKSSTCREHDLDLLCIQIMYNVRDFRLEYTEIIMHDRVEKLRNLNYIINNESIIVISSFFTQ